MHRPIGVVLGTVLASLLAAGTLVPSPASAASDLTTTYRVLHQSKLIDGISVMTYADGGTYTLDWHLEQDDSPIAGASGSASGTVGPAGSGGLARFEVDGTNLPDGTYQPVGTIVITDEQGTVGPAQTFSGTLLIDTTGPSVTQITASRSTIYPQIRSAKHPGTVDFRAVADFTDSGYAAIVKDGKKVASMVHRDENADGSRTFEWDGRGTVARLPAGLYELVLLDQFGNRSAVAGQVTVSTLHYVAKVWRRAITARASLVDRFVGRCATLRSPSSHGWRGSLGLYTNTKCRSRQFQVGGVQTLHSVKVPISASGKYGTIAVDTYGGSARSKRGGTAVVGMLTKTDRYVNEYRTKAAVGRTNAYSFYENQNLILPGSRIAWAVNPARPGDRYDVRTFYVTLRYTAFAY